MNRTAGSNGPRDGEAARKRKLPCTWEADSEDERVDTREEREAKRTRSHGTGNDGASTDRNTAGRPKGGIRDAIQAERDTYMVRTLLLCASFCF